MSTLKDYKVKFYLIHKGEKEIFIDFYCVINYNELICKIENQKSFFESQNDILEDIIIEFIKEW